MIAVQLLGGLALLLVGGEFLVRGSVKVASAFGVSPLLIGLTLVGFGTSTPELVTSIQAALIGSPGIAVGNIVGSNIANILLILGIGALICPLAVSSRALKRDGGFMLTMTVLFVLVGFTVGLERWVGAVFVALLIGYLVFAYRQERVSTEGHGAAFVRAEAVGEVLPALRAPEQPPAGVTSWLFPLLLALVGLVGIVFGGRLLVDGAVALARLVGMSEEVIGLTIVAVGTSAPELVTTVVAAFRKQAEVALGNVLGSNIYNLLGIGGFTALVAPTEIPAQIASLDAPFMLAVSALLVIFAYTSKRLSRVEGTVFLAFYIAYVAYLVVT